MSDRKKNLCEWCGRGSILCPATGECLSVAERLRLLQYIDDHGRGWKAKLRREWANGSSELRQTRNIIGPSRLSFVKPTARTIETLRRGVNP